MNGNVHPFPDKRPMPPGSCPFCNSEPMVLTLPAVDAEAMTFAIGCPSCGTVGPPAINEALALSAWNQRAKDDPSSCVVPETAPETGLMAAALVDLARHVYANEMGGMRAFVLVMLDPLGLQPRIGIHIHGALPEVAMNLCSTAANIMKAQEKKSLGGIIIP